MRGVSSTASSAVRLGCAPIGAAHSKASDSVLGQTASIASGPLFITNDPVPFFISTAKARRRKTFHRYCTMTKDLEMTDVAKAPDGKEKENEDVKTELEPKQKEIDPIEELATGKLDPSSCVFPFWERCLVSLNPSKRL